MANQVSVVSIFNRGVMILVSLLIVVGSALVASQPRAALSLSAGYLSQLGSAGSTWLPAAAAAVGVLAFLVLAVEVWPRWRRPTFVARIDGGTVEYAASVVAEAMRRELANVDGLRDYHVEVAGNLNKVRVRIRLQPDYGSDPSTLAARLSSPVREKVKQLGLEVEAIRLTIEPEAESHRLPGRQPQPTT